MGIKDFLLPAVLAGAILGSQAHASDSSWSSSSSCSSESRQPVCTPRFNNLYDPIIGSFGIKSACGTSFGVIAFNAGGTLVTEDSLDLFGQLAPHCHRSLGATVGTGHWKKIKKHKYHFVFTKVVSLQASKEKNKPTCPKFRLRVQGVLDLHRDRRCFIAEAHLTRWHLDDLACEHHPFHCEALGFDHKSHHLKLEGKKIEFCD